MAGGLGGGWSIGVNFLELIPDYIVVKTINDFPAPVAGVITLAPLKTYVISGFVNIGDNRIVVSNGDAIIGFNQAVDGIIYTGTSNMITASNVNGQIKGIFISCTLGTVFNMSSSGSNNFLLQDMVIYGADTLGGIVGFNNFVIQGCIFSNSTTNGFLISNAATMNNFAVLESEFNNNTGTLFNFSNATLNSVIISVNNLDVSVGQIALAGTPTVGRKIIVSDNNFYGAGTFTSGNIIPSNVRCLFNDNYGVNDSEAVGEMYFAANASSTAIAIAGTYYKASGTTTDGNSERFTHSNNRLTYDGIETIKVLVSASFSVSTGNNNQTLGVILAKGGVTVASTEAEVRQTSAGVSASGTSQGIITLSIGNYVELFVTNKSTTNAVTVEYMNFEIR